MANAKGLTTRVAGGRTRPRMVEEFVPQSGWTDDSEGHYLLINLPGFTGHEVRLRANGSDNIKISGERQVDEDKCIYFDQTFQAPQHSDMDNMTGKFEGEILHVTVPKRGAQENSQSKSEKQEDNVQNRQENEHKKHGCDGERHQDQSIFKNAMKLLSRNKGIVLTALIAISIGLAVSHKSKLVDSE